MTDAGAAIHGAGKIKNISQLTKKLDTICVQINSEKICVYG